ncbi:MAG: leucine-rich repeat domain-containing protein [Aureispira sp.]|nr:leucine-rich repeat domain-containing protein [Aureispira sp.]
MQANKDKIKQLLYTGEAVNVELAMQLADSQSIDLSTLLDNIRYFYINGSRGSLRKANLEDVVAVEDMIADIHAYRYVSFGSNFKEEHYEALLLLKKLSEIYFYYPSFDFFPKELFELKELWRLVAVDGELKTVNTEVTQLEHLRILRLTNNKIKTIPDNIGDLISLQELYLNNNNLVELPKSIGRLENLKTLFLGANQLQTLPKELLELKSLAKFSVYGNPLDKSKVPKCLLEGDSIVAQQLRKIIL